MTTVHLPYEVREGWGVAVTLIHQGENDEGLDEDSVADLDATVVRIAADAVKMIGNMPCVKAAENYYVPLENFRADLPAVNNDCHDARDHWFATEVEAREHAASVLSEWANPLPWQSFIHT